MRANTVLQVICLGGFATACLLAQPTTHGARQSKAEAKAPSAEQEIAEGRKVYKENCSICHYSTSTAKKIGPGLKGLSKRGHFADGKKVNDENLREWIKKGGKDMPSFGNTLKPDQVRNLIAYLKTL